MPQSPQHRPLVQSISQEHLHKVPSLEKLHGLSLRANYTDRETAACRQSDCQLLRIGGATWLA
jgi:hypothetical protein